MQNLFPIIRRVRRPLLVRDAPPVLVGNVEPVKAIAECEVRSAEQAEALRANPMSDDAQTSD